MKIWGYWATFGWSVLAFIVGQFLALAFLVWWRINDLNSILATPFDGKSVTLFIVISNPLMIAVLAGAVRLARASQIDYLALHLPRARDVAIGIAWLIGLVIVSDLALYFGGRDLITPFQSQSYATRRGGRLAAGASCRRYSGCARRRRDHVPRLYLPRLGAFRPVAVAGDLGDFTVMGGAAHPI